MNAGREVVITGIGVISPIGIGAAAFRESLRALRSGVRAITQYDASELSVQFGGEVQDFEPKLYVKPRKSLKVMSREIQMGVASATLAMEEARIAPGDVALERLGVIYGSPMLYANVGELADQYRACLVNGSFNYDEFGEQFSKQMLPLWLLKYLPNMTASHIGIAHGAQGPNNSIVQGDSSSLLAMSEAADVIRRGLADVMLSGGAGNRLDVTGVVYRGDSNLSHRADDPAAASRPFDRDRDGMVIGEGACTIVLEERNHAEQRNATILGQVLGFGTTHTGRGGAANSTSAIARSIQCALRNAGVPPSEVGQVNAHGQSDQRFDVYEANAIRDVLGETPVTAPKSYFGNVGAASGALELAASLLMNEMPATLNFETPDPDCPVNVSAEPRAGESPVIAKLNQNGTGQAAAILVRKC